MKSIRWHFPAALFLVATCVSAPAFAQSLAMTYGLDASDQSRRASISNAGCAAFGWVGSAGTCAPDALGRFSRRLQNEQETTKPPQPVAAAPRASPARAPEVIPYLGENSSLLEARSHPAATLTDRDATQADWNLRIGAQARSNAVTEAMERRLRDTAYESRSGRSFNAVGFELSFPIHARILKSADPALPE